MNKLIRCGILFLTNKRFRIKVFDYLKLYTWLPDKQYLDKMYFSYFGKHVDFENPVTFNEKIQWLKLYDRKDFYTSIVDKYEIKKIIEKSIGIEYVVPNYGVWKSFDEIDFSKLPDSFVLKTTHDSGGVVICHNKREMDFALAKKKLEKSLSMNYYNYRREWPYKNVKPRIIAEKDISINGFDIDDYKVFCFGGKPTITLVCSDRFSESGLTEDFYDNEWNHLDLKRPSVPNARKIHKKPEKFNTLLEIARMLSEGFPFLRVDFFVVNQKVYIGELTLYPASGFDGFEPESWDYYLGDMIKLPDNN